MLESVAPRTDQLQRFSYPWWTLSRPVSWLRHLLFCLVLYPITRILCRADVRGLEHLQDIAGPVLFASNHITRDDPALIMSVLPHRFRRRLAIAMDGEMLESFRHPPASMTFFWKIWSVLKYYVLFIFFNVFPLPRLSGFRKSFNFAGESMDRGNSVLIFPEGELTKNGKLQKFHSGVGILADGLECPIVPVRIDGLWELKAAGVRYYAPPGSVTINFGEPIQFETGISPAFIAKTLEDKVSTLPNKSNC
jgi:long-chain acyl-CoA synthetase